MTQAFQQKKTKEPAFWHQLYASAHLPPKSSVNYRKIPLILIYRQWVSIPRERAGERREGGVTFRWKNTSICNLSKLLLLFFFQYNARISVFLTSCKMLHVFKVNNKDTIGLILVSLMLTLNIFQFLLQCFYFWISSANWRMGFLLVGNMETFEEET